MADAKPYTRIPALDAARALGVAAMVTGHTLDALLATTIRSHPAVVAYWKARGFTAPVFIAVAGWAVAAAIQRSGARGWEIPASRGKRAALLIAIGVLLLWPGWGIDGLLAGEPAVFAHLVSFGVLHTIGLSILATSFLFAAIPARRARLLALGAAALLSVALGLRAPGNPHTLGGIALEQAIGGTSPFPLFPWMAYFFAGSAVGLLVVGSGRREVAWLAGLGAAIVGATFWTGVGTMPFNDPILVVYRVGVFLLLIAGLSRVPASVASRLAPLGRASLGVYAIHVPIVYGWSSHPGLAARVGPRLGLAEALLVAVAVLLFSLVAERVLKDAWRRLKGAAQRGLDAAAQAFGRSEIR
ncbi:MAG: heparan-alpha-glucosaminide N-acetyltransferase domain-containing protein [Anaeromyxobacteraceae bacterium]